MTASRRNQFIQLITEALSEQLGANVEVKVVSGEQTFADLFPPKFRGEQIEPTEPTKAQVQAEMEKQAIDESRIKLDEPITGGITGKTRMQYPGGTKTVMTHAMMGEPHPPKDRTLVGYMLFSNDRALSDSFDRHHECIERVVKAMRDTHAEMEELAQVVGFTVPSLGSLEIRPVYAD